MIVYGDATRQVSPGQRLAELEHRLEGFGSVRENRDQRAAERHAGLVTLFIDASELAQGLIDREFERLGSDDRTPLTEAAMNLLMPLARTVVRSWRGERPAPLTSALAALDRLAALPLPATIEPREAEGYAFYATYPEAYLEAAQKLPDGPLQVIGIRSIGMGLAALIAAARGAAPPITVRPIGHPFQRRLALSEALLEGITPGSTYAVVDEGPGLSGSSFGAVLDLLESRGVPRARIHVLPGHPGPLGPQAAEGHRDRWAAITRHHVGFQALALDGPSPRLLDWAAPLLSRAAAPRAARPAGWRDLSGGAWRAEFTKSEADWPPAAIHQERLKFLVEAPRGPVLLKFSGLGPVQDRKLARAKVLAEAGFTPPVLGAAHGFQATTWLADAEPLRAGEPLPDGFLARVADYLAFRVRRLPAAPDAGADRAALAEMLLHNGRLALGPEAEAALQEATARLNALPPPRRHATDNRLQRWEWLRRGDGSLLKADAIDHCEAHDLIGCQDLVWDLAGASVEWDLEPGAATELRDRIARQLGTAVDAETEAAVLPAYLAFQIGLWHMAADAAAGVPAEAERIRAHHQGLVRRLAAVLGIPPSESTELAKPEMTGTSL